MVVEAYLESGHPVGSRTISRTSTLNLSPASIRNVMQDLEESGLLEAPHTSAGAWIPTESGLRCCRRHPCRSLSPGPRTGPRLPPARSRRADRGGDLQRHRRALRPLGLRRNRAGSEGRAGASPARLRALVAAAGGGGRRRQRRRRRKPGRRPAARSHARDSGRGRQLCLGPPLRPDAERGAGAARERDQGGRRRGQVARALVERGLAIWSEDGARRR